MKRMATPKVEWELELRERDKKASKKLAFLIGGLIVVMGLIWIF